MTHSNHARITVKSSGWANAALEVANEFNHKGFDHRILKDPEGEVELMKLARQAAPGLLVATSGYGDGKLPSGVARTSDFLLPYFNGTSVGAIPERIAALKPYNKPIICNEDDKAGAEGARAVEACEANGVSWGLMLNKVNQYQPFTCNGAADDSVIYAKRKALTMAEKDGK